MDDTPNGIIDAEPAAPSQPKLKFNPKRLAMTSIGIVGIVAASYVIFHKLHPSGPTQQQLQTMNIERQQILAQERELSKTHANAHPASNGPNASAPNGALPDGSIKDTEISSLLGDATKNDAHQDTSAPQPDTGTSAISIPTPPSTTQIPGKPEAPTPPPEKTVPRSPATPPDGAPADSAASQQAPHGDSGMSTLAALPNPYSSASPDGSAPASDLPILDGKSPAKPHNPGGALDRLTDEYNATQREIAGDQQHLHEIASQIAALRSGNPLPNLPSDPKTPAPTATDLPTNVIANTTLLAATQNGVTVKIGQKTSTLPMGSIIPGIGKARTIVPWNGTWQLVTDSGLIRPDTARP